MNVRFCLLSCVAVALPLGASAAPLTPGNVLIVEWDTIMEITLANGSFVQQIPIDPPPGEFFPSGYDAAVDGSGRMTVFNEVSPAWASTYDPATDQWSHSTHPGWTSRAVASHGGIAVNDTYIFAPDQETNRPAMGSGLIRIRRSDDFSERFAETLPGSSPAVPIGYTDAAVTSDGRVFGLRLVEDAGGFSLPSTFVDVYDASSLAFSETILLDRGVLAFDVDAAGRIAGAVDGGVALFDDAGSFVDEFPADCQGATSLCEGMDVDFLPDGRLLAAIAKTPGFSEAVVIDPSDSNVQSIFRTLGFFHTAAVIPEPSSVPLLALSIALFVLAGPRHRRQA